MPTPDRHLFVNLPVRDLEKSKAFFAALGFSFNPQFTDENAACMIVGEKNMVMLLTDGFFRTFTSRRICDGSSTETLVGFSCADRAEVDALTEKALAAGGSVAGPTQDHGFMYSRAFYDVDGHHWEAIWMDPAAVQ
jgi:predicted lactoylglutathione lyase